MGEVYEAIDHDSDARVAIKVLRWRDPRFLNRFKREFRILEGLAHPNLATLGSLHDEGGDFFFTMELVEGSDVLQYVWGTQRAVVDTAETLPTIDTAKFRRQTTIEPTPRPAVLDLATLRDALRQPADVLT